MADAKKAAAEALREVESTVTTAELEAQVEQLKRDIAALTQTLAAYGSAKLNEAGEKAAQLGHDVKEASSEAVSAAKAKARSLEHDLEDRIREKPLHAVGIAAGIGFLFALFTRR